MGLSNRLSGTCPVSLSLSVAGICFLGHLIPIRELVFLTEELLLAETLMRLPRSTCLEIRLRIAPAIRRELGTQDTSIGRPASLLHTFWSWCISLFSPFISHDAYADSHMFAFLNLPLARKRIKAIRILGLQFKLYYLTVTSDAAEIEDRLGC